MLTLILTYRPETGPRCIRLTRSSGSTARSSGGPAVAFFALVDRQIGRCFVANLHKLRVCSQSRHHPPQPRALIICPALHGS